MNSTSLTPPRIVLTLGVYRSASTWAANVATEILRLQGPAELIVGDSVSDIARRVGLSASAFVIKTHRPDASLRLLVRSGRLPVILSVRDPLDCVASLLEHFQERYESARSSVCLSCESIVWMLPFCVPLILPYEASRARDAATVARIAAHLGVSIADEMAATIAARFAPDEVKRLIEGYTVQGVFGGDPKPHQAHAATQWHPGHLGSGDVGRHHAVLTPAQVEEIRRATLPFRQEFAYVAEAREMMAVG